MQSWNIDPEKRDYVMEKGAPQQTDSLKIPAYFRLRTSRTQWLYAPDDNFGSDLYLIRKRKTTQDPSFIEATAGRALQPLVDDGRSSQITVATQVATRNALGLEIQITDAQGTPETFVIPGTGV